MVFCYNKNIKFRKIIIIFVYERQSVGIQKRKRENRGEEDQNSTGEQWEHSGFPCAFHFMHCYLYFRVSAIYSSSFLHAGLYFL